MVFEREAPVLPRFTPKELRVVELVTRGMKNKDIGVLLGTSEQVIKNYMRIVLDKTGMDSRLQVALWWLTKKPDYLAAGLVAE
jgi:DNA-binding NarL/FixJ family response regulator